MLDDYTSTTELDGPLNLTLEKLLQLWESIRKPVIFYMISKYFPESLKGQCIKLPSEHAPIGFDLILHPDNLPALETALLGKAMLRLLDDAEFDRRWGHKLLRLIRENK